MSMSSPFSFKVRKEKMLLGHKSGVYALIAGEESNLIYSGAGDGWITKWDISKSTDGQLIARTEAQIFAICLLRDHKTMVAGDMNGEVYWIDLYTNAPSRRFLQHKKGVFAFIEMEQELYSMGADGTVAIWDIESRDLKESLRLSHQSLRSVDHSPDGELLAVGASDGNIYILDTAKKQLIHVLEQAHRNSVFTVKFSPEGTYLVSGGRDAMLKIWSVKGGFTNEEEIPAHWYTINDLAFSPDQRFLATASRDKTIRIWDAKTFELQVVIDRDKYAGHLNSVNCLYWSSYNNYLFSAGDDRSIIVWDVNILGSD